MGSDKERGKGKGEMEKGGEGRTARAAELYVQCLDMRNRLYDHYAEMHVEWIALRKAGKTDLKFKDYVVSEEIRGAKERHPGWPAGALVGIGEMARMWMEAWYA